MPGRTDRPLAALLSCPRFAIIQQAQQVNPIEWLEQVMVAADGMGVAAIMEGRKAAEMRMAA